MFWLVLAAAAVLGWVRAVTLLVAICRSNRRAGQVVTEHCALVAEFEAIVDPDRRPGHAYATVIAAMERQFVEETPR